MGEPEFSPAELDRLEDALEGLEGLEDLGEFDDAPALRDRLQSFQEVMAVSREAMPMEDVPAGLLDAVVAQAREEAVVVKAPQPETRERGRLGRWLVPVLSLVGGAAAVLFVVQVGRQMNEASESSVAPELAKAETPERADAEVAAEEQYGRERQALWAELDDALAYADETPEEETDEDEQTETIGLSDGKPGTPGAAPKADPAPPPKHQKSSGGAPKQLPNATKKEQSVDTGDKGEAGIELDKDELYDLLAEADKKRRQGKCGAAESRYKQVIVGGPDPMAKARAQAGLGLCAEYSGDLKGADQFFSQAKSGYAGISSWIETERAKMPAATEAKKKSRPKKKGLAEPAPELDSL